MAKPSYITLFRYTILLYYEQKSSLFHISFDRLLTRSLSTFRLLTIYTSVTWPPLFYVNWHVRVLFIIHWLRTAISYHSTFFFGFCCYFRCFFIFISLCFSITTILLLLCTCIYNLFFSFSLTFNRLGFCCFFFGLIIHE